MEIPKLFVSDLDKTLLRSDLSLSRFTVDTINELISSGMLFTFATARSFEKAQYLLRDLHLELPCIVLNGAAIVKQDGSIVVTNSLLSDAVSSVLKIGRGVNLEPFILGLENGKDLFLHGVPQNNGQKSFLEHRKGDPRLRFSECLDSIEQTLTLNYIATKKELENLQDLLKKNFPHILSFKFAPDPYLKGYYSLEVLHPDADKSIALAQLSDMLSIAPDNVIVFGDHYNDLEMLSFAGRAIAVRNAEVEVIAAADEVIGSNDEDGVANYLKERFQL